MTPVLHQTGFANAGQELHDAAIRATGFDDFGDPGYLDAFDRLLRAYDECLPAGPSPERDGVASRLTELLIRRLYVQAGHRKRPDARSVQLKAPLFILGLPRTGTTALQHMLARDPQFQGLHRWLAERPMPRPPRMHWADYPEFQRSQMVLDAIYKARPAVKGIHFMAADEVDECSLIMTQTFSSGSIGWSADLGDYTKWLHETDLRPQYRYYADVLRLIGADDGRTWLLKCPHHALHIDALLAVFPDARIVFLHRDPVELVPSICSLTFEVTRSEADDPALRVRIGRRHLANLPDSLRRIMAVRTTHPGRICDVRFKDFLADPVETARSIYTFFDLEMTSTAEASMEKWRNDNPKGKHGGHRYRAEDFGIDPQQIAERFAFYRDHE